MLQELFRIPFSALFYILLIGAVAMLAVFLISMVRKTPIWEWLAMAIVAAGAALIWVRPRIGQSVPMHGYGLMMVVGFLGGMALARFLARRSRIDPEVFVNCGIIALISGIAGARLSHVIENFSTYTNPDRSAFANFFDAINISSGGLTFYGGFILATFCCIAYGMYRKVPIRRGMDIIAPCLMIGLGFGRVGCFLNGCCEGGQCGLPAPLGVQFPFATNPYVRQLDNGTLAPDQLPPPEAMTPERTVRTPEQISKAYANDPATRDRVLAEVASLHSNTVHNAQLYSMLTAFMIAGLLVAYYTLPHAPGRVFALMMLIEAPCRYILEMLRAEPIFIGAGSPGQTLTFLPAMSYSMFLSVWLFLIGVALWFVFKGKPDDMSKPIVPAGVRLAGA